jgi:hypothetical protein
MPQHFTLSGVPNNFIFHNGLALISKDVNFCREKEKKHLIISKSVLLRTLYEEFPQSHFCQRHFDGFLQKAAMGR